MTRPDLQASEKARNAIIKLQGFEFRGPEDLADFLKKEEAQFSASDLTAFGHILATRFGRYGGLYYIPEWLTRVFSTLTEGLSPKTLCDPWAGIGLLIGVLRETSKATTTIAFTSSQGEHALGKVLVSEANWQVGAPLRLLRESSKDLDLAASILPMGVRAPSPLQITLPSGNSIELADQLGRVWKPQISLK